MNAHRDPLRWKIQVSGADPTLRRALTAATRERPSKADVDWMKSALSARLGHASTWPSEAEVAGHAPSPPLSPAPAMSRLSQLGTAFGKFAGVLVVGSAMVGGGVWATRTIPNVAPTVLPSSARLEDPSPSVSASHRAGEGTRLVTVTELRYDRAAPSAERLVEPRTQTGRGRERPRVRGIATNGDDEPSVPTAVDERPLSKPSPVDARPSTQATAEDGPPPPSSGVQEPSETEILLAARRALASDPAAALGWVRQHERRFPSAVLAQEREIIAIDALRRLGRVREANARAKRFYARYPSSIHGRSIESPEASAPAPGSAAAQR